MNFLIIEFLNELNIWEFYERNKGLHMQYNIMCDMETINFQHFIKIIRIICKLTPTMNNYNLIFTSGASGGSSTTIMGKTGSYV